MHKTKKGFKDFDSFRNGILASLVSKIFSPLTSAYWDATRAFMILSLLACFIGIVIGVMAFIHYSSFDGFDKTFAAGILFFISCKLLSCTYTQAPRMC